VFFDVRDVFGVRGVFGVRDVFGVHGVFGACGVFGVYVVSDVRAVRSLHLWRLASRTKIPETQNLVSLYRCYFTLFFNTIK
jgi:hypothetical protein